MLHKSKVSAKDKARIVRKYLSGKIGQREAARRLEVSLASIQRWIKQYEAEGRAAFLPYENYRTYTAEVKTKAVLSYLHGEGSLLEVCKNYKIRSPRQLRLWLKVYNAHGGFNAPKTSGGGSYMNKGRSTTQEERLQIAREALESGKNYGEIAKKYNVSYQQVRMWTLRYEELGNAGLEDRRGKRKKDQTPRTELEKAQIEIEKLKHQLYMAEMERDLLKKLTELERGELWDK